MTWTADPTGTTDWWRMDNPESDGWGTKNEGPGPKAYARLDTVAGGLLLLWVVLALLGLVVGLATMVVDVAAWVAFGAAISLVGLPRWLYAVSDKEMIGPHRLWVAACTAGLIFCLASSFIAATRVKEIQAQIAQSDLPADRVEALSKSLAKAKNFSMQFLCIRMALAVGLAVGAKKLPKTSQASETTVLTNCS